MIWFCELRQFNVIATAKPMSSILEFGGNGNDFGDTCDYRFAIFFNTTNT
jgi:hypothetical protein